MSSVEIPVTTALFNDFQLVMDSIKEQLRKNFSSNQATLETTELCSTQTDRQTHSHTQTRRHNEKEWSLKASPANQKILSDIPRLENSRSAPPSPFHGFKFYRSSTRPLDGCCDLLDIANALGDDFDTFLRADNSADKSSDKSD